MDTRQEQILEAIVREYQKTGQPVASQILVRKYGFDLSPASIRSQMLALDKEGYLAQPYTSAGRIPTTKAYRMFVDKILERQQPNFVDSEKVKNDVMQFDSGKNLSYNLAQFLADFSNNLGLSATFGEQADFHEAGLPSLLDDAELRQPDNISNILRGFEVLEKEFVDLFEKINQDTEVFIGEENPIDDFRECSLILSRYEFDDEKGLFGILGPKRMDYAKNISLVEETKRVLRGE